MEENKIMTAEQLRRARDRIDERLGKLEDTPEAFVEMQNKLAGMNDSEFELWTNEQCRKT